MNITLVRHSTLLIDTNDIRILVDPFFGNMMFPVRAKPPDISSDRYLPCDLVVCTHAHPDHFELKPVLKAQPDTPIVVRPKDESRARKKGATEVHVVPLWEEFEHEGVKLTAVPAVHMGGAQGYVLEAEDKTIFLAGDTMLHDDFKAIAERFPTIDVAFLPVDGMRLLVKRVTMNVEEALEATRILKPHQVVPIHLALWSFVPGLGPTSDATAFVTTVKLSGLSTEVVLLEASERLTVA